MKTLRSATDWTGGPVALTIGNFDGVHRGHREILSRLAAAADSTGAGIQMVLSFEPHPATVVRPDSAPLQLATPGQKRDLLASAGVDALLLHPFDRETASLPAEAFVKELLVDRLRVRAIVVGAGFRFGKGRHGNVDLLRELGAVHGFEVEEVPPLEHEGVVISSSRIREAVASGWIETANAMLGRPHELVGTCVPGASRGKSLGFPTANLHADNELLPAHGVYVTEVEVSGQRHPSVTNIGVRPTFRDSGLSIESHLLEFEGELRGESMQLRFFQRLREERAFSSAEDLARQIELDVGEARTYFRNRENAD